MSIMKHLIWGGGGGGGGAGGGEGEIEIYGEREGE